MRPGVLFLLAAMLLGACGADTVAAPPGVRVQVEQTRQDLQGRDFQVQVVNGGEQPLTVEHVEFESDRLEERATYDGPTLIPAGATVNLTMSMPRAACGDGLGARVHLTYAVGEGEAVTSIERPSDHFGSVGRFMLRDCAESSVGDIRIDDVGVRGEGADATLDVVVTVTPPQSGDPVRLVDVGGSTLLAPAGPDATAIEQDVEPGGPPVHAELTFIPNRCDVHAVAEDRTGGILPLRVDAAAFGTSPVYLRFDEQQKATIFGYLAERCGFDS